MNDSLANVEKECEADSIQSAISLRGVSKFFAASGQHRRPLYRELLRARKESVSCDAKAALAAVDLDIPRGAAVAILGPNGAGKSTLLRTIAGIYQPSEGSVDVAGRVACFFEAGVGIAPTLALEDNIHLYGAILGLGREDTSAGLEQILTFAELQDQRRTCVEHLSFGTQQRLFFSIMLYAMQRRSADVFLFDEWLAGADLRFRRKGQEALEAIHDPEMTSIYASHDLECLESMCETAVYVKSGGIRLVGPFAEVAETYRSDQGMP